MPRALTTDEQALLNSILDQCIYALGTGAQMPITREAIADIRADHVKRFGNSDGPLFRDPNPGENFLPPPGEPRWVGVKADPEGEPPQPPLPGISRFILECSVAIGQFAANKARSEGRRFINTADIKAGYKAVQTANSGGGSVGGPGEWCV